MKKIITIISVGITVITLIGAFAYRKEIKLLCSSLNGFKDENLANTFQNMYKIQPTKEIRKGNTVNEFSKNTSPLPINFKFKGEKI